MARQCGKTWPKVPTRRSESRPCTGFWGRQIGGRPTSWALSRGARPARPAPAAKRGPANGARTVGFSTGDACNRRSVSHLHLHRTCPSGTACRRPGQDERLSRPAALFPEFSRAAGGSESFVTSLTRACYIRARGRLKPARIDVSQKCRFCHFPMLTRRGAAHITRPPLTRRRRKAPTKPAKPLK